MRDARCRVEHAFLDLVAGGSAGREDLAHPVGDDGDRALLRRGMQLSIRASTLLLAPVMFGLAAVADSLVPAAFGKQWVSAVPILQVLSIAGALYPIQVINLNALMAQGHAHLMFRLEVAKKGFGIALILLGLSYGLMGIAWSQLAFVLIAFVINTRYAERFAAYGLLNQLRDVLPALVVSGSMAVLVSFVGRSLDWPPSMKLLVLVPLGVVIFAVLVHLFRLKAYQELLELLANWRNRSHQSDRQQLLPEKGES